MRKHQKTSTEGHSANNVACTPQNCPRRKAKETEEPWRLTWNEEKCSVRDPDDILDPRRALRGQSGNPNGVCGLFGDVGLVYFLGGRRPGT